MKDYVKDFRNMRKHLLHVLESSDSNKISRRGRAPLLGFIGTISRKLFGTMDYNDHEHLTKEIDRLFNDQRQITHLISNSTHLIQAEMNSLKDTHMKNAKNLEVLETQIKTVLENDLKTKDFISSMEYMAQINKIGNDAEFAARKYLENAGKLIEALEDAKHGKISPLLLNHNRTLSAVSEIEQLNKDCVFPISREKMDLAVLSQISRVMTGINNGRFLVTIIIPLLSRDHMELYRMIPCKSRQVYGNQGVAAFIQPRTEFIMVSRLTSRYTMLNGKFLERCATLESCLACPKVLPLRKTRDADCEYNLLMNTYVNPAQRIFRDCKVLLTNDMKSSWTELSGGDGWLFSIMGAENLVITCADQRTKVLEMRGTGIFKLNPNCTAESATIFLEGSSDVDSQLPMISGAPATINISEIAPVFQNPPKIINLLSKLERNVLPNATFMGSFEKSMQQTIQEAEEIGQHHQEAYTHQLFTLTNCSVTGILSIITGLMSFMAIRKGLTPCFLFRCCWRRRKTVSRKSSSSLLPSHQSNNQGRCEESALQAAVITTAAQLRTVSVSSPETPSPPPPPPFPPALSQSTISSAAAKLKRIERPSLPPPPPPLPPSIPTSSVISEKVPVHTRQATGVLLKFGG